MRLTNSIARRLSALEAVMKPAARVFCMFDRGGEGSPGEREAAFRLENGVGPNDTLHVISFQWTGSESPAGLRRNSQW